MRTLCIDVGGTGIKGTIYDEGGRPLSERVRIPTPRPATPDSVMKVIEDVARAAGEFDRVSCGFPGVVVNGVTKNAPNLDGSWDGYRIASDLELRLGRPSRAANDADVQGLAVVEGIGVELVLTLGTGVGSGLYLDGKCLWNLELGHHPWKDDDSYEDRVDDRTRKRIGNKKWRKRISAMVATLEPIFNYRKLYLGGGNSEHLDKSDLPDNVVLVDNSAGTLGGLRLWA
jgi:polyphosphate glucokinase